MSHQYLSGFQIFVQVVYRFWPVWASLVVVMGLSFRFRDRLGLYGQLYDTGIGIAGILLVGFWLFVAIFSKMIAPTSARYPASSTPGLRIVCGFQ